MKNKQIINCGWMRLRAYCYAIITSGARNDWYLEKYREDTWIIDYGGERMFKGKINTDKELLVLMKQIGIKS